MISHFFTQSMSNFVPSNKSVPKKRILLILSGMKSYPKPELFYRMEFMNVVFVVIYLPCGFPVARKFGERSCLEGGGKSA